MLGWLRAWLKSWLEVQKTQHDARFQAYYNEYLECEAKRWAKEMKDAKILMLAVMLMHVVQCYGMLTWIVGVFAMVPVFVVIGVLALIGSRLSLDFLMETGRVRDEARRYAFDMMRGD